MKEKTSREKASKGSSLGPIGVMLAALVIAGPVGAQGTATQASTANNTILEEVVVTGLRRGDQKLMDAPASISAISGDTIEQIGATSLADFLQTIPGVSIFEATPGETEIQIRGIGSDFGDSPVGYYLDDTPLSHQVFPFLPDVGVFDLERVEVLRGPQGTLYGANSLGGTVRILTRDPQVNEFELKTDVTGSKTKDGDDNYLLNAAVNVPLIEDKLAFRLTGSYRDMSGWYDDPTVGASDINDSETHTLRGKLLWTPTDNLLLKLTVIDQKSESGIASSGLDDRTLPVSPGLSAFGMSLSDVQDDYDYTLYNALIEYEFAGFKLISSTSYSEQFAGLQTTSPLLTFGFPFLVAFTAETTTQELRLVSTGDGPLSWTTGVFYNDLEDKVLVTVGQGGFVNFVANDSTLTSESVAVFGEVTLEMLEGKLELTAGGRYFQDKRGNSDPLAAPGLVALGFPAKESETFEEPTFKFNVGYRLNDDWLLHGTVASGYRSGAVQGGSGNFLNAVSLGVSIDSIVDAESLVNYEIGAKGTLFDGRVNVDMALYYMDWKDPQASGEALPGLPQTYLFNGPDATAVGFDWSIQARLTDALTFNFSGNVNNSEYDGDSTVANINEGDQLNHVPDTTMTGSVIYRRPLDFFTSAYGFAYLGAQYNAERESHTIQSFTKSQSITKVDFRIGLETESWDVMLFVDNLTDEDRAVTAVNATVLNTLNENYAVRLRPRTVGLNLKWRI